MDDYLKKFALQNGASGIARTFVAVQPGTKRVEGYYSISAGSIRLESLSEEQRKGLPRYPVPVAHVGRLAVDQGARGKRLGEFLLMDALRRIDGTAESLGIHAVDVVAIDEIARAFWLKYGFIELLDDKRHLYIPMKRVRKLGLNSTTK